MSRSREVFGLLIAVGFVLVSLADIWIDNYEIPGGWFGIIGALIAGWFSLGLVKRNGGGSGRGAH